MKMNFLMGASLAGSLLASTASFAAADTVVAIVDGKNITFEEVMKQKDTLGKELKGVPEDKLFPLLQNKVVNDIIIEKAARESNIAEKEEVKKALEMMTQQFLIQAFLADKIKGTIEDGDVKKKYEDLVANFPDEKEAKLRHILVSDKSKADQIVKALKNRVDFKKLVEKSEDKATAKRGGEIGYMAKSMLPKEISDKIFEVKAGDYTPEPVKTELGWHIFMVDEYRDAKPPSYEESKEELKTLMAEETLIAFMKDLREQAKVQLLDKDGKPLPKPEPKEADKTKKS